jgi:hypothetical protein
MLRPISKWAAVLSALSLLIAAGTPRSHAQNNVLQPGDPIIASSSNSPGSEGVANAIDGKPTKYLNFDTKIGGGPSGFVVTPSVGVTVVVGMTLQSANDGPERDPKLVRLEGSNDDAIADFASGNWELITQQDNIPVFENRFETKTITFNNAKPYRHYRWTVVETATANTCCFQIAEVGLLGSLLPSDITQPGDPIIASSSNSPGSEGVANAIDGKETKYLNFDTKIGGGPSGFIVTPSVGLTRVTGMSIQSANDGPERDPRVVTLEGSNDPTVTDFASGTWELITRLDNIPAFTARFQSQYFTFANEKPYRHYRWTVIETATANTCCFQVAEVELLGSALPPDVTQPGDPIIASSSNSPGSEGVANAIDGKETKYLNFDTKIGGGPSGFVVTPSIGRTLVTGITLQSANDAPERDPKVITLEGSNDDTVSDFAGGTWEQIVRLDNIPTFAQRFQNQTFVFPNIKPYRHYRLTIVETATANTCCMQIAEVELLGTGAPQDVTQPGDPIIASSSNSPGSEGVANAIDGKETKYLNFDTKIGGGPSGFVVTPAVGATTIIGVTMQSANDAPERDPRIVTIEGSNDSEITDSNSGAWELIVRLDNIPAYTARFQTQEFYFQNAKAFKHYRWTVIETQTPNTCCFQIAEVEFLALVEGADCTKARFVTQPVDTPVLLGNPATFTTVVNGPWPLQWLRNGEPIPGATRTAYTTDPITVENSTNIYAVQIVGCEKSSDVRASVFTPSTTKSIGISFIGGGANGAPTSMNTNDIAGVHPQAYWNNANGGSGDLPDFNTDPPSELVDSDNQPATVTFNWQSSGAWGAGTGADSPTQRMLNGLVGANAPGNPYSFTFSGVPAGNHAVLIYAVSPPLQFQNVKFTVSGGGAEQTAFIRTMNSDEYNAAPGFYRGLSTSQATPTVANFVRFDGVRAGADGTIVVTGETLTGGFDRQTGVNALQLVLNAPSPGAPPAISADPQPTVAAVDGTARMSVTATGDNLTYQWRKDGRNLPNGGNISGATTSTLTISDFTEADEGIYSVAVFNAAGSIVSKNAALRLSEFDIEDRLVAYWKMNETSGTSAANAVSGGSPVAFTGSPAWAAGQVANAVGLDGTTHGEAANYTKANRAISGSAWVRPAAGAAGNQVIFRNAFGDLVPVGGAIEGVKFGQFELRLAVDANGALIPESAIQIGPNVSRVSSPTPITENAWHHIAFSADGAQQRLYVDGQQVAVIDYLANINQPDIPYITVGVQFNYSDPADITSPAGPDPTNPNYFTGSIDELALWTRVVTPDEISKIYEAGRQGQELTSVVVEPPTSEEPAISVAKGTGGNLVITFEGTLQSADAVTGPYTNVAGASSPYTTAATDAVKFFRASR